MAVTSSGRIHVNLTSLRPRAPTGLIPLEFIIKLMDKSRQMEDTESRNTRKLTGVSLATQYRLCVAPKRPEQRKITRKKKLLDELKDIKRERRGAARKLSDGVTPAWMKNNEEEEFDFDGRLIL